MNQWLAAAAVREQSDRAFNAWERLREHLLRQDDARGAALCGVLGEEVGELLRACQRWQAAVRGSQVAATRRRSGPEARPQLVNLQELIGRHRRQGKAVSLFCAVCGAEIEVNPDPEAPESAMVEHFAREHGFG